MGKEIIIPGADFSENAIIIPRIKVARFDPSVASSFTATINASSAHPTETELQARGFVGGHSLVTGGTNIVINSDNLDIELDSDEVGLANAFLADYNRATPIKELLIDIPVITDFYNAVRFLRADKLIIRGVISGGSAIWGLAYSGNGVNSMCDLSGLKIHINSCNGFFQGSRWGAINFKNWAPADIVRLLNTLVETASFPKLLVDDDADTKSAVIIAYSRRTNMLVREIESNTLTPDTTFIGTEVTAENQSVYNNAIVFDNDDYDSYTTGTVVKIDGLTTKFFTKQ